MAESVGRSPALFYWVRLVETSRGETRRTFPRTAWRPPAAAERDFELLGETVRGSGGQIVDVVKPEEMADAFRKILAELREQYVLGFYPIEGPEGGGDRPVKVEIRRSGLEARWKNASALP